MIFLDFSRPGMQIKGGQNTMCIAYTTVAREGMR